MLSADAFNLEQSRIASFGEELKCQKKMRWTSLVQKQDPDKYYVKVAYNPQD